MAVVEPGVTYEQLQEALAKEGLTLAVPMAPKANKSVVASLFGNGTKTQLSTSIQLR